MDGVTGWRERHSQSRALEWASVSVWRGFNTSYGEHKAGYLGNKNADFEMGQTKSGCFSTALGKDGPQRSLSYPLLLFPGVWEKLQGAVRRKLQGWEQTQEQAAQGLLGVQMPSCSWSRLSLQHIKYLSCSLYPLLGCFTSLFPFPLSLSLKCATSSRIFYFYWVFPPLSPAEKALN